MLEVPSARVDRSMGDVHPRGNPHFSLDPGLAPTITQNIVDGLARVAPESRATFEQNRAAFLAQLEQAMARWTKAMEPVKGSKVVVFHPDFIYSPDALRPRSRPATVEDRPGIPPSPQHLANLIRTDEGGEDQGDPGRAVERHQAGQPAWPRRPGAKALVMATAVGAVKGADNYIAAIDYNITTLAQALR